MQVFIIDREFQKPRLTRFYHFILLYGIRKVSLFIPMINAIVLILQIKFVTASSILIILMSPKHNPQAGSSYFSQADIKFLDRLDDSYKSHQGSSSSDPPCSSEYDSDGFSDDSEDSKDAT